MKNLECIWKGMAYLATGISAIVLWWSISHGIEVISSNNFNHGMEQGYTNGYRAGTENYTKKLADILEHKFKQEERCELKEYILTEKRITAIMHKSNSKLTAAEKRDYIKYITRYAKKYELSPILVAAIIHRESNFKNSTTSDVGAIGPMQVWPKWHTEKLKKHKLTPKHLYSTQYGVLIGCEVLREYIDREDGDFRAALYRYVGGQHHGYVKDIFTMCEYAYSIKI